MARNKIEQDEELESEHTPQCRERQGEQGEWIFLMLCDDAAEIPFQNMGVCV